jgi:hypothetical protein
MIDKKILSEIERYKSINQYITEQAAGAPVPPEDLGPLAPAPGDAGAGAPPPPSDAGTVPPPAPGDAPQAIDVASDPDVEKIDDEGSSEKSTDDSGSEELEITDLVNSQKNIETKQDEYFENLFR